MWGGGSCVSGSQPSGVVVLVPSTLCFSSITSEEPRSQTSRRAVQPASSADGTVEDFTRLDDSPSGALCLRVERGSDVLCRGNRNAAKYYRRGMVSHCAEPKIVGRTPLLCNNSGLYHGGKKVTWDGRNVLTPRMLPVFPLTCECAWWVSLCRQTGCCRRSASPLLVDLLRLCGFFLFSRRKLQNQRLHLFIFRFFSVVSWLNSRNLCSDVCWQPVF